MKYKTAIFDMDGTILDTLEDLTDAVNAAMRFARAPERTPDEVRAFVGNGAKKLMERSLPAGTSRARVEEVLAFYRPYYESHAAEKTAPYAGIPALLAELRRQGMRLAVASNKPDGAVKRLAAQYFPGLFDAAVGERPGLRVKPAPDLLLVAMQLTGARPEETVYIGDSDVDIATAANTGTACVSVAWGFRDEAFLRKNGAKRVVCSAQELYAALTEDTAPPR